MKNKFGNNEIIGNQKESYYQRMFDVKLGLLEE